MPPDMSLLNASIRRLLRVLRRNKSAQLFARLVSIGGSQTRDVQLFSKLFWIQQVPLRIAASRPCVHPTAEHPFAKGASHAPRPRHVYSRRPPHPSRAA